MLPDLRAAIAAIVAAVALLLAGFGVAATFRVAQETRSSPLQAARTTLLTEPALRLEDVAPVVSRDDTATADHPDETARIAPPAPPPVPAAEEPAPAVVAAPTATPAPVIAAAPAPEVVIAAPEAPSDTPETTASIAAAPHADAPVAAVPEPEPPVGGPLEQAALTPTETPGAAPVVRKKPRVARPRTDERKARAKVAKKRLAPERARRAPQKAFQQNNWQQNSWQANSWQQNRPAQPAAGYESR